MAKKDCERERDPMRIFLGIYERKDLRSIKILKESKRKEYGIEKFEEKE